MGEPALSDGAIARAHETLGRIKEDGCAVGESRGEGISRESSCPPLASSSDALIIRGDVSGEIGISILLRLRHPNGLSERRAGKQAGQTSWTGGSSCWSVEKDHPVEDSNYPLGKAVSRPH